MNFFSSDIAMTVYGILMAVFILGILVAVHEAGHLLMAKWSNIRVDRFSIGMGKPIWGFQFGETYYQIGILPFGGFCAFGDEENGDREDKDPRALMNSPLWARLLTVIGGSLFNIIFAFFMMALLFRVGFQEKQLTNQVCVYEMLSNSDLKGTESPAWKAGMRSGDIILNIDGQKVTHFLDIPMIMSYSADREKKIEISRDGIKKTIMLVPISDPETGIDVIGVGPIKPAIVGEIVKDSPAFRAGFEVGDKIISVNDKKIQFFYQVVNAIEKTSKSLNIKVLRNGQTKNLTVTPVNIDGRLQIGIQSEYPEQILVHQKAKNIFQAFALAAQNIHRTISQIILSMGKLFSGQVNVQKNLSGPVRIISITGEIASTFDGALIVKFMVMLSLALATFNLLPFPGLDGGAIILQTARSIFKDNEKAEKVISFVEQAGIMLLLALAAFVFVNDIRNIAKIDNKAEQKLNK